MESDLVAGLPATLGSSVNPGRDDRPGLGCLGCRRKGNRGLAEGLGTGAFGKARYLLMTAAMIC